MEARPVDSVPVEQLAWVFNSAYSTYPGGGTDFTGESLAAWLKRNLISLPHSYAFFHPEVDTGADDGKQRPVGYCFIAERPDKPGHSRIATFGIAREAQGKRLGSQAIRMIVEGERKRGVKILELECVKTDTKTLGMYQRLGWEEIQDLPEWGRDAVSPDNQEFKDNEGLEECTVEEVDKLVREFGDKDLLAWQAWAVSASRSADKAFKLGHAYCVISDPADKDDDAITVVSVFVEPEWRRKGEASKLVRAMMGRFKGKKWEVNALYPRVYGERLAKVAGAKVVDEGQVQMRLKLND